MDRTVGSLTYPRIGTHRTRASVGTVRVGYVQAVDRQDIAHGAPSVLKRYVTGGWGHLLRSRTLVPSLSTPHLSFT